MSTRVEAGVAAVTQFRERLSTDSKARSKWLKQQKLDVKPLLNIEEYLGFTVSSRLIGNTAFAF